MLAVTLAGNLHANGISIYEGGRWWDWGILLCVLENHDGCGEANDDGTVHCSCQYDFLCRYRGHRGYLGVATYFSLFNRADKARQRML